MKARAIRNILVPVDFSTMSDFAIDTAKRLVERTGGTIHLVHAHEEYDATPFMSPTGVIPSSTVTFQDTMVTIREARVTKLTRELGALARNHGLSPAKCHVRNGAPVFNEICAEARDVGADLIVMPTHGYTGITHFLAGSTTERVVQHSPCPVFVTRRRGKPSAHRRQHSAVRTVLAPVDFSAGSLEGLRCAIDMAERFRAKLIVFHAVYPGSAFTSDAYPIYDVAEITAALLKDAEKQMREFVGAAKFRLVKFSTVTMVGPEVSEICALAEARAVDLIVASTHGRTGFKHLLIGSVAEQVVRRATCSVLVVPSHPQLRAGVLLKHTGGRRKTICRVSLRDLVAKNGKRKSKKRVSRASKS